jgi:hypothetical protein
MVRKDIFIILCKCNNGSQIPINLQAISLHFIKQKIHRLTYKDSDHIHKMTSYIINIFKPSEFFTFAFLLVYIYCCTVFFHCDISIYAYIV